MEDQMDAHWPAEIPRDFRQLRAEYGDFIAYMVQKYGAKDQQLEDLTQHIWVKLMEVDILTKYVTSLQTNQTVPDTITGLEACALLGISFGAWRSAHWSYQVIFKKVLGGVAPVGGKNRGCTTARGLPVRCTLCKGNGAVEDDVCPRCDGKKTTGVRTERWVLWMPEPIFPAQSNSKKPAKPLGPLSSKARFKTKQVIALAEMGYFRNILINLPTPTASPAHFKNYLRRAIKNHFANWVRTKKRRHKERPVDVFPQFQSPDGETIALEEKIVDPNSVGRIEARAGIEQVFSAARSKELLEHAEEIAALLDEGRSLERAIKELGLSLETRRAVKRALDRMV